MFEFLKLLPLTGRMADCWFTQGDCPGLGASAPSGRVGLAEREQPQRKVPICSASQR